MKFRNDEIKLALLIGHVCFETAFQQLIWISIEIISIFWRKFLHSNGSSVQVELLKVYLYNVKAKMSTLNESILGLQ